MRRIQFVLEQKQLEIREHKFFRLLPKLNSVEQANYFIPQLTFWAMTFQDILRLNEQRIKTPLLHLIAKHHRAEDRGHEKWFLKDKYYLSNKTGQLPNSGFDTQWLFGESCQSIRDAAYALVSEVFRADDEHINIALILALESSGHIFFEEIAALFRRLGEDDHLKYFSTFHLEVEKSHQMFEQEIEEKLFSVSLEEKTYIKIIAMIDRAYNSFNLMFDALYAQVEEQNNVSMKVVDDIIKRASIDSESLNA